MDAQALFRIGSVIDGGGDVDDINRAWEANLKWSTRYKIGFANTLEDTVLGTFDAVVENTVNLGLLETYSQKQAFEENLAIARYIVNNPTEFPVREKRETLIKFLLDAADGDAEAIGRLSGNALLHFIGLKLVRKALKKKPDEPLRNLDVSQAEQMAFNLAVAAYARQLTSSNSGRSLWEQLWWHNGFVRLNIREIEKNRKFVVLNKVVGADGQVTGYRTVFLRNGDGIRDSPDIIVVNVETGEVWAVEIKTGAAGLSKNQNIVFEDIKAGRAVPTRLFKDLVDQYNAANPEVRIPDDFYKNMGEVEVRSLAGILD